MDINEVNRVCYVCGKKAGFVPKDKVVGICMDICDICGKRRACTDFWHDWQKKETIEDIVAYLRQQNLGMPDDMECVSPLVCDMLRLADRIEKAYKFMVEGLNDGIVERDQYIAELTDNNSKIIAELNEVRELNRKCCDENERLHSALQHVLKVELNQVNGHPCADGDYCTSSEFGVCDHDGNEVDNESIADALSAVGRAQRIYNEGEK